MRQFICIITFFAFVESFGQYGPVPSFFKIQRELPLVELTTTSTISVSDYGAVTNDGNDDTVAIQNAINAAANLATLQNPVRLLFESGTYDLITDDSNSHALEMIDANGVLWDGQGAEFLVHNASVGFLSLLRCENTIIKDFEVDYANLPFTQGVITNVDVANGYFDFKVDNDFPLPTSALFVNTPQRWGMIKNSDGSLKKGADNLISHRRFFESIAPRTYRYGNQTSSTLQGLDVGDYFVHIARNNGKTIIRNTSGKNLTYMNVTAYTSPAGGFNARESEEWNVINCQIKLKEGRVHTLNADAMHVNGGRIGPWVENSLFEGFADDGLNLKYTKRVIKTVHSPTEITVVNSVFLDEEIEFYNPRDGIYLGSATITNVQNLGSNQFKITLSNAINITTIADPDHQSTDKAFLTSRSNQSFVFKNNIIRNIRRHGILIQSKYALIENNTFENISSSGIAIENGVDWGEGFRATDIVINNNSFINCGFDTEYINKPQSATILVDFRKLSQPCNPSINWCGVETSSFQAHSNITISNNEIIYNKRGVYIKNTNGVNLHNNFICHSGQDITLGSNQSPIQQTILNSSNVSVINFDYELPSPNVHFVLDDSDSGTTFLNTGSVGNVGLEINLNGGIITQGHYDSEVGYSVNVNTASNGSLNLVNSDTQEAFVGPVSNQARTYAFWIKPEESIFQNLLVSGGPNDGEVFSIQMMVNGVIRVTDNDGNTVRMADMPMDIGSWNHVLVSVPEGAFMRDVSLYKNGMPSNESFTGENVILATATSGISLFSTFKGTVSDFRYFDYSLCNGEVEMVYNDRYITLSSLDFDAIENELIVYPTITSSIVNFSEPVTSIEVFDIKGNLALSKESPSLIQIDVSRLTPGFYLLKINKKQVTKIIKK